MNIIHFKKHIFILLLFMALLCLNKTYVYAEEASILFTELEEEVSVDETFQLELKISAQEHIGKYEIYLLYDKQRMEYIEGAEAEEDGIITLSGTGFGTEILYHVTFKGIRGGVAGIALKEAFIYTIGNEEMESLTLSMEPLSIEIEGEDTIGSSFLAEALEEEVVYPLLGSIEVGEEIYSVVDLTNFQEDVMDWEYRLITDTYQSETFTFLTDQARNTRLVLALDAQDTLLMFAYDREKEELYPVDEIVENNRKYYIMSIAACVTLPETMSEEEKKSNSIFWGIDVAGVGSFYRYTKDKELVSWEAQIAEPRTTSRSLIQKKIIIGVLVVILLLLTLFVVMGILRREKIKKKVLNQLTLLRNNVLGRKQYFFVIKELTTREIKRKYARSILGIAWSVLNPLLTMVVMSTVFSYMFKRSIDKFPLYYLTGSIIWTLFSEATSSAMTALVDNKTLLLKAKLPKQTFVLSRIYTSFVNFGYTCIAYILMLVVFQVKPSWLMCLFFLDMIFITIFAMGIGYILSILYVFFADIKYLYSVALTLLLYLSAIFYPVSSLPPMLQTLIGYNPLYLAIYIARETVVYQNVPHYSAWIKLGIAAIISFTIGLRVFKKTENNVMQKV